MAKKAPKKAPLARPSLEKAGWTLYHSGGGCIVWCKSSTAGTIYMADYNELVAPEDMRRDTACGVSVADDRGECVLNMYFPTVTALLDACIELDGKPLKVEPANERSESWMRCEHCGASATCNVCRDHEKDFGVKPVKHSAAKCRYGALVCTHHQCQPIEK